MKAIQVLIIILGLFQQVWKADHAMFLRCRGHSKVDYEREVFSSPDSECRGWFSQSLQFFLDFHLYNLSILSTANICPNVEEGWIFWRISEMWSGKGKLQRRGQGEASTTQCSISRIRYGIIRWFEIWRWHKLCDCGKKKTAAGILSSSDIHGDILRLSECTEAINNLPL